MKKILLMGASALFMLGACGVDKEGTGDNLVKDLEKATGAKFTDDQKDCLRDVIKGMSDDEIKAISEQKASPEAQEEFNLQLSGCIGGGTGEEPTDGIVEEESSETLVEEVEEEVEEEVGS